MRKDPSHHFRVQKSCQGGVLHNFVKATRYRVRKKLADFHESRVRVLFVLLSYFLFDK